MTKPLITTDAIEASNRMGWGWWYLLLILALSNVVIVIGIFFDWRVVYWLPAFLLMFLIAVVYVGKLLERVGYRTSKDLERGDK
jgi:hypothetical protein